MWKSTRLILAAILVVLASHAAAGGKESQEPERTGGPYVPTPQVVVDHMLRMAGVGPDDFVIDLGSGDGVIVLTAAKQFKARGHGVDIDPELVKQSNLRAKQLGVADRVTFQVQDVFKTDLSRATVVTLYLLPSMMSNLQPKVFSELRPGARVVSHDYHFGEWPPDDQVTLDVPEKEAVNGIPKATIYLWIVPAKVSGKWRVNVEGPGGGSRYELDIKQKFQAFKGTVSDGTKVSRLDVTELSGERIRFAVPAESGRHIFVGRVSGDTMRGTVDLAGGKGPMRWTAVRTKYF